jgi:glutamate-5-semialdehyde dehydrogenase
MAGIGRAARASARALALATEADKNRALAAMAAALRGAAPEILAANAQDLADARAKGQPDAFVDRLALDAGRLEAVAAAVALQGGGAGQ